MTVASTTSQASASPFQCHSDGVKGIGPLDARIMIIGHAPGYYETRARTPFVGPSGQLMNRILEAVGYDRSQCYLTNLYCSEASYVSVDRRKSCLERLQSEIAFINPKIIVLLGEQVHEIFFPLYDFTQARGMIHWHSTFNIWMMPTYHTAAILRSKDNSHSMAHELANDVVNDFAKLKMFFSDNPTPGIETVKFAIAQSARQAQSILDTLPRDKPIIIDVETDNSVEDELNAHSDKLLCLGLSGGGFTWVIHAEHLQGLKWPTDVQYGAHSAMFDFQVMLANGVDLKISHDSLLAHFALHAGSRHGLKTLARQYCYSGFYEKEVAKYRKGKMAQVPTAQRDEYNAKDTAYSARLLNKFIPKMQSEGVYSLYQDILIPAANVFKYMQYDGVPININRLRDLDADWFPKLTAKTYELKDYAKRRNETRWSNFNPNSGDQLAEFLFSPVHEGGLGLLGTTRTKSRKRFSTNADVLEELEDQHEFVEMLQDLRHFHKLYSTYVSPMLGFRDPRTKRLHPRPLIHGTVGGRCSYADPAINTMPRPYNPKDGQYAPALRRLFTAEDDDHVIIEADFKQAELWVAYYYSQDATLGQDLQGDIHTTNAKEIYNTLTPNPGQRSDAKRTTFGILYLIGARKLARQTKKPVDVAAKWLDQQSSKYWRYYQWVDEQYEKVKSTGYVETVTKRRRHFPIVLPQDTSIRGAVANFPIQATSHDFLLAALIDSYWPLRDIGCNAILDVHDAVIFHAKKRTQKEAAQMIHHYFTKPRFGLPGLQIEIKAGYSWAETKDLN